MRLTRDASSPWGQRLWVPEAEFDFAMDSARLRTGSSLFIEGKGVDLDTLLERGLKIVPDFVPLSPPEMGKTLFFPDGRCEVYVDRDLAEAAGRDDGARHRFRSTLAHECAHVILHGDMHLRDTATGSLFGDAPPQAPQVQCRAETVGCPKALRTYNGKWWEYQANRGMAALLLPKQELGAWLRAELDSRNQGTMREAVEAGQGRDILRLLMRAFDVSLDIAVYRLQGTGALPGSAGQAELALG